jgi:hypothetical protein
VLGELLLLLQAMKTCRAAGGCHGWWLLLLTL